MKKSKSIVTELARDLRKDSTNAEKILWNNIRNRKLFGIKFTRQQPIIYRKSNLYGVRFFIADFLCFERKIVIEIDGEIHNSQKEYDTTRTQILNEMGYTVIRFTNSEVENDLKNVVEKIKKSISHIDSPPTPL